MQVIILAAGMGKRLGELTKNNTKCMIRVNGVTLIERVLAQFSVLNLNRVIIVIGYKGEELRNFIGDSYKGLPIEYVINRFMMRRTISIRFFWPKNSYKKTTRC